MRLDVKLNKILRIDLKEVFLLFILKKVGPIGRYKLVDIVNLPEGIIRGLLTKFQKNKYISSNKQGSKLTTIGEKKLTQKLEKLHIEAIRSYDGRDFKVGPLCIAVQVKRQGKKIRRGIEERDSVNKGGAKGAIILSFENGKLIMPGLFNLSEDGSDVAKKLTTLFELEDTDIILIVFAENYWRAVEGAFFAADSLGERS